MPLGYLRRPLFLATVLYIEVLLCLHGLGLLEVKARPELERLRNLPAARLEGRVVSPLTHNRIGERVVVEAQRISGRECRDRVLVYLPKARAVNRALLPGMGVTVIGKLRLPRAGRNPGDFDERSLLSDRAVAWVMRARSVVPSSPAGLVEQARWMPWSWAETARRSFQDALEAWLPLEEARLMTGLCLGYKGPLRPELNRAVQDAGVMHLLVPSGAKVAFVLAALAWLASLARLPPAARFALAAAGGGFYTLMVGGEAPYARAYLGGMCLYGGLLAGRECGAFQGVTVSALLILLHDPRALFSAGFQMTYAASAGLVLGMPALSAALPRAWPGPLRRALQIVVVTIVVQVMLWPIFANVFERGALVGVIANLVLVPASGAMMAGGFALWVLDGASSVLAAGAAEAVALGADGFRRACFFFASWPWAAIDLAPMSGPSIAAFYAAAAAVLILPRLRAAGLLAAAAALLLLGEAAARAAARPAISALILSLPGTRAASGRRPALLEHPSGERWLVDPGGPAGSILSALQARGAWRLDRIVVSGVEPERWAGLARVLEETETTTVQLPRALARERRFKPVWERIARGGAAIEWSRAGPWRACAGAVCFEFGGEFPRVRRGEAEFYIIPARLKRGAIEVTSDGSSATIIEVR